MQRVVYPGLTSHPQADIIRRIFPEGRYGAMLKFDIADCSQDKAFRFLDALELIRPATTLGDVYSLIVYPARTTHRFLSDEEMATLGIGHGTFRMSVGIETADDLKADLEHALGAL